MNSGCQGAALGLRRRKTQDMHFFAAAGKNGSNGTPVELKALKT
jgi:hypothetical protein